MTYRIPAGYGQLTEVLQLDGDNEPMVITIGVGPNIADDAAASDWVAAAHGNFGGDVMPELSTAYTVVRGELAYHLPGEADDDPFHVAVNTTPYGGTQTNDSCPQNVAHLIHKRTSLGGRQGRGRFYLPSVREDQVSEAGQIATGQVAGITSAVEAWRASFEANPLTTPEAAFFLFHNLAEGELIADLPTQIIGLDCDGLVATQRRRVRK